MKLTTAPSHAGVRNALRYTSTPSDVVIFSYLRSQYHHDVHFQMFVILSTKFLSAKQNAVLGHGAETYFGLNSAFLPVIPCVPQANLQRVTSHIVVYFINCFCELFEYIVFNSRAACTLGDRKCALLYLHVVINMKLWNYYTDIFLSLLIVSRSTVLLQLSCLATGFLPQRLGFLSQVNPLGFEVEKVTAGWFFHQWFSLSVSIYQCSTFIHQSS